MNEAGDGNSTDVCVYLPAERVRRLLETLQQATRVPPDQAKALRAVVDFLDAVPAIRESGITHPLHQLLAALPDLLRVATRYNQLQDALSVIGNAADAVGADERSLCAAALKAHIDFLDADEWVLRAGSARPLKRILAAFHDAERGTLDVLFKPRNVGSRPTLLTRQKLNGTIIGVLQQITLVGKSPAEAARLVADRLRKLGVRDDDGKDIPWAALLKQYRRIDKQPQDTQDAYDAIRDDKPALTGKGSEQEIIEDLLDMLVVVRNYS